ncbi:hypothetical protein PBOI14_58930 [Pseudomonas sp. Boi14]|nr:hypothetical protein PBOI14_58930 [Pseudomonas sp. Boi14]
MTKFSALFAAAALTLTAGLAQADVRPDLIPGLLKSGAIMDLEKLNQAALAQHRAPPPPASPTPSSSRPPLAPTSTRWNCATAKASSGTWTWMPRPARS